MRYNATQILHKNIFYQFENEKKNSRNILDFPGFVQNFPRFFSIIFCLYLFLEFLSGCFSIIFCLDSFPLSGFSPYFWPGYFPEFCVKRKKKICVASCCLLDTCVKSCHIVMTQHIWTV